MKGSFNQLSCFACFLQCLQKASVDDVNDKDKEYKPHDLLQRQNIHVQPCDMSAPARRAKRMKTEVNVNTLTHTPLKWAKKLYVYNHSLPLFGTGLF